MNAAQRVNANRLARKRLNRNVAKTLNQYVTDTDNTRKTIAAFLSINEAQLGRLLKAQQTPETITVERIARLCGVTMEQLMNGK